MSAALSKSQLRITALWAFSEAFLGGILHGFQVPFTGLVLSAFAAISMCALASKDFQRGKILHATFLVMIIKLTLSPHTPFTAYFAVLLQGCCAELLFSLHVPYKAACYITAIFALMQSALQKLIVLTVLFGMDGWMAFDEFLNGILQTFHADKVSYSIYIIYGYLLLHLIAGIITGNYAAHVPALQPLNDTPLLPLNIMEQQSSKVRRRKRTFIFWLLFIVLLVVIYVNYADKDALSFIDSKPLKLIIRASVIMVFWYFFLSPLLMNILKKWLTGRKNALSSETEGILVILPEIKQIVFYAWMISAKSGGVKRILVFVNYCFRLILTSA